MKNEYINEEEKPIDKELIDEQHRGLIIKDNLVLELT